jgi:DNA recombination protein RmuC
MTALEVALGGTTVILAIVVLVLALRDRGEATLDDDAVRHSVSTAISDLDLDGRAAQIETHAREMKAVHDNVEQLLQTPQHRGSFGEHQLETILADQLPPDVYGTQETVIDGKRPDAYVETADGIVAIDAKFPLEAFERAVSTDDPEERARHEQEFARRVDDQLDTIATEYVRPDAGTTNFAFAFVPSERVYYHLVTEEYDLLSKYVDRGVQVVSPLTLGQKLELIKAGVHAQRLSEQATAVQARLEGLDQRFEAFADEWETARRHLSNANDRAADADEAFDRLRAEFERIGEVSPTSEEQLVDGSTGNEDGNSERSS